jgi:DNA-binding SARP family transcriptional activator
VPVGYVHGSCVLEFRILGALEAHEDGEPVPLGGPKQRALLAILLLSDNEPVSVDRLVDELWGERPPGTAAHSIEVYVSRLRKVLGPRVISTQRPGYRVEVEPGQLDLHRFEQLAAEGRGSLAAGDAVTAVARLREGLGLWRGPPLTDFTFEPFAQSAIARLEELRLAALEDRIDADLALGHHAQVIGELEALVERHPLRERLRGQLMLGLYRAGRQAEALEAYARTRAALVDELGIEPSPALQRLERAILKQEAALELAPQASRQGRERTPAPSRSILIVGAEEMELDSLLALGAPLAGAQSPHEVIVVNLLPGARAGELAGATDRLQARRSAWLEEGIAVRAAAFTSEDAGADLVRLASQHDVDLLLLEARGSAASPFAAELATVLDGAPCDVALLVAGDPHDETFGGPVVVPFGGGEHDWSALELGAWLAGGTGARLVLCGAVADRGVGRRDASRLLATASLVVQQLTDLAAEPVLTAPTVEGVVGAAEGAGAVVLGSSERWRSEGLGDVRAAIAAAVGAPCLVVRRGPRPGGLSPPESMTRFTWSLAGTPGR